MYVHVRGSLAKHLSERNVFSATRGMGENNTYFTLYVIPIILTISKITKRNLKNGLVVLGYVYISWLVNSLII